MPNLPYEYIVAVLVVVALIILFVLIKKIQSDSIKNDLNDINVRFNAIKSVPLAFKLNKATYIAKINEETAASVDLYREKFDTCQKNMEQLQSLIDGIEDDIATKKTKQAKESILVVKENLKDSEEEVKEIETFLDSITQREHVQREYSNQLKEQYRELKSKVSTNVSELSLAYDGIEDKLRNCENLFSSFEEQIYANEFAKAQNDLETISISLKKIEDSIDEMPELLKNAKGIIPTLIDEVNNRYNEALDRGIYLEHLDIENKVNKVEKNLNENLKSIVSADTDGVKKHLDEVRGDLDNILNDIANENHAYEEVKTSLEEIHKDLEIIDKTYYYIQKVYDIDKEKYDLNGLDEILKNRDNTIQRYSVSYNEILFKLKESHTAASALLNDTRVLYNDIEKNKNELLKTKNHIDKASNDESRAQTQVVKLQIVLNEVEVKIAQYRLPAISDSYKEDLRKGHDYVKEIKEILTGIPLNITLLNTKLDEAIDFIYKLYNNVNNVVGMALMVENAIVFGNKYRSSYPEVDAELSKAEFAYLNGEYTQSLTIAIACIEKLFPKSGDDKIMEYAKGVQ